MTNIVPLKRPGAQAGDYSEVEETFGVEPFELYGRHHEVSDARATVGITRVTEGLHLDLRFSIKVETTCDRTLEPVELDLEFADSELLAGANNRELSVEDWTLDLSDYAGRALPSEVPLQVFAPGTEPVVPEPREDEIDPRWRGLDDLFASGF